MSAPDGGVFRCVLAEDCPLPDNMFVCVSSSPIERDCVACEETSCIRHIPEPCK